MKPSSNDLRRALLAADEQNQYSQRDVAALLGVRSATVRHCVRRHRDMGPPDATPRRGGQTAPRASPMQERVRRLWLRNKALTLAEFCEQIAQESQTRVRVPTMGRVVHRLGLRRKKRPSTRRNVTPPGSSRRG